VYGGLSASKAVRVISERRLRAEAAAFARRGQAVSLAPTDPAPRKCYSVSSRVPSARPPPAIAYLSWFVSSSTSGVGLAPWTPCLIWARDCLRWRSVTRWLIGRFGGSTAAALSFVGRHARRVWVPRSLI
jgi:hypothetical protein